MPSRKQLGSSLMARADKDQKGRRVLLLSGGKVLPLRKQGCAVL